MDMMEVKQHVENSVPHVQQSHNWDCGLACARMALGFAGKSTDNFHQICRKMRFGESVWSIDLANIMVKYGVPHHYCTVTIGVCKGFSSKIFYRANFDNDEKRVNNLFEAAPSIGINLECRSVTQEEILQHLDAGNILIALVDWSYLSCKWCDHKCLPAANICCIGKCLMQYQGHFIIVCGYDLQTSVIYYKNPSYKEELCCSSIKNFEQSRKSYGTDEDILFIFKPNTSTSSVPLTSDQNGHV